MPYKTARTTEYNIEVTKLKVRRSTGLIELKHEVRSMLTNGRMLKFAGRPHIVSAIGFVLSFTPSFDAPLLSLLLLLIKPRRRYWPVQR